MTKENRRRELEGECQDVVKSVEVVESVERVKSHTAGARVSHESKM